MFNRIEVLADAIAWHNSAHEISSSAYTNRNPGLLRAYSPKHPRDAEGLRVFSSILDGYQALLFDLKIKCSGKSSATLPDAATIADLFRAYGSSGAKSVAKRVRKVLNIEVTSETPLVIFLENQ